MGLKQKANWLIDYCKDKPLIPIIIFSFLLGLGYLFLQYPLWWDSHIYILIGKYIFSLGETGLWESFRPLLHPILLGLFWKLNLSPILFGKLFDVIFSTAAVYLTYKIAEDLFDKKVAILSAILFSITPVLFIITGLILADPLALFLSLLGARVLFKKKHSCFSVFLGGLLLGLAFLTRFQYGLWFGTLFLVLVYLFIKKLLLFIGKNDSKKIGLFTVVKDNLKIIFSLSLGFILPVLPYFYLNYYLYDNPFQAFISGQWIITTATWLYEGGLLFYFIRFFAAYPAYLFFFIGVYFFIAKKLWKNHRQLVVFLLPILALIYFVYIPRKEVRYMLVALPFLAIVSSYSIFKIYNYLNKRKKKLLLEILAVLCLALLIYPLPKIVDFETAPNYTPQIQEVIDRENIAGKLFVSGPHYISSFDNPFATVDGMAFALDNYQRFKRELELYIIDSCDIPCGPNDLECLNDRKEFMDLLLENSSIQFNETYILKQSNRECTFTIILPQDKFN